MSKTKLGRGKRRLLPLLLAFCLAFAMFPAAAFADALGTDPSVEPTSVTAITGFEALAPEVAEQALTVGDETEPVLPDSLAAATVDGTITVSNVTWSAQPAFDPETAGTYTFTAVLPEGYTTAEETALPEIIVVVSEAESVTPTKNGNLIQPRATYVSSNDEAEWVNNAGDTIKSDLTTAILNTYDRSGDVTVTLLKDASIQRSGKDIPITSNLTIKSKDGEGPYKITRVYETNPVLTVGKNYRNTVTTGSLTIDNVILDGGAVWDGSLTSETTNTGMTATNAFLRVEYGTATLTGNTVLQNNDLDGTTGAGVHIGNGAKLTVTGNTEIVNNRVKTAGGGVSVGYGATLEVSGNAVICGNVARGYEEDGDWIHGLGGGIYAVQFDTSSPNLVTAVALKDSASVTGNTATLGGGGIFMEADTNTKCKLTMEGESQISGNTTENRGGGGVFATLNTDIVMSGNAQINGNNALFLNEDAGWGGQGGGLNLQKGCSLGLSGNASIHDNEAAKLGGGVMMLNNAGLTMKDDSIIHSNSAVNNGGGVYAENNCSTAITDRAIMKNNTADNEGGGIYMYDDTCELTVSGKVTISGNTKDGAANNIYLPDPANSPIVLAGSMTSGARIGVHLPAASEVIGTKFASGTNLTVSDAKAFFYDSGAFGIVKTGDGSGLELGKKPPAPTPTPSYSGGSYSSEFYVTVITGANGSIKDKEGFYTRDEKHTFTVVPDEGYVIDTVTLDDGSVLSHTDTQFTLLVNEPYEVHVTFKKAAADATTTPAKPPVSKNPQTGDSWFAGLF